MLYKLSRTFARIMPGNILVLDLTSLGLGDPRFWRQLVDVSDNVCRYERTHFDFIMLKTRYFLDLFACNAVQNMLSQIANYAHPWMTVAGSRRCKTSTNAKANL
jgi:hypothetical protein